MMRISSYLEASDAVRRYTEAGGRAAGAGRGRWLTWSSRIRPTTSTTGCRQAPHRQRRAGRRLRRLPADRLCGVRAADQGRHLHLHEFARIRRAEGLLGAAGGRCRPSSSGRSDRTGCGADRGPVPSSSGSSGLGQLRREDDTEPQVRRGASDGVSP